MLDITEVAKFDALADQWWDLNGGLKTLHQINPVRLTFIQKYLPTPQPTTPLKILDVGCGGGILTESLARQGYLMTGIDASKSAIEAAKRHAEKTGLTSSKPLAELTTTNKFVGDAERRTGVYIEAHEDSSAASATNTVVDRELCKGSIDYRETLLEDMVEAYPSDFDAVTCMELLEHVADPAAMIKQCAKLVKPGGMVFFSTINRTLKAYALAIVSAEYLLKLLPKGTHHYEKFIRPAELDSWARAAKLDRVALTGMYYNPLTQQAKLVQDVSVNFLVCYKVPY